MTPAASWPMSAGDVVYVVRLYLDGYIKAETVVYADAFLAATSDGTRIVAGAANSYPFVDERTAGCPSWFQSETDAQSALTAFRVEKTEKAIKGWEDHVRCARREFEDACDCVGAKKKALDAFESALDVTRKQLDALRGSGDAL